MVNKKRIPAKYYSIPEAARILGVSRIAVYKQVKNGKIRSIKVGRNYCVPANAIVRRAGKILDEKAKTKIEKAVKRVVREYGETLRLLGKE